MHTSDTTVINIKLSTSDAYDCDIKLSTSVLLAISKTPARQRLLSPMVWCYHVQVPQLPPEKQLFCKQEVQ